MAFFLPALAAAAGPIAKHVLAALGIGLISFAALTALVDAVISHVQSNYSNIPASVAQLLDLAGFGTALGIILGGIAARAAFGAISRFGKLST